MDGKSKSDKVKSHPLNFLLCYLLMAIGGVIGMLLQDGFRWHSVLDAAYAYAVGAFIAPFVVICAGLFIIVMAIALSAADAVAGLPLKILLALISAVSYGLMLFALRRCSVSRSPWVRWLARIYIVAYSAAAIHALFMMVSL